MANYADKTRTHHWIYLRLKQDEPAVTITHFRKNMLIHPEQDRGLSVREAARIQSFKDTFLFCGPLMHQQQQVANAVPPCLLKQWRAPFGRHLASEDCTVRINTPKGIRAFQRGILEWHKAKQA